MHECIPAMSQPIHTPQQRLQLRQPMQVSGMSQRHQLQNGIDLVFEDKLVDHRKYLGAGHMLETGPHLDLDTGKGQDHLPDQQAGVMVRPGMTDEETIAC